MRYLYEQLGYYPDLSVHYEAITALYHNVIGRGKGIELNASGIFQAMSRPMPDCDLLKLYRNCGGEIITIGCDAHYLKHVGCCVKEAQEVLREAGFRYFTVYEERKPVFHKL